MDGLMEADPYGMHYQNAPPVPIPGQMPPMSDVQGQNSVYDEVHCTLLFSATIHSPSYFFVPPFLQHQDECIDDGGDSDGEGGARRRGRPRERKAFIQNSQEVRSGLLQDVFSFFPFHHSFYSSQRRKYFMNRVKAIKAKAETFAKCTGQDILCMTVDEDGCAHFWGSPSFERRVPTPC